MILYVFLGCLEFGDDEGDVGVGADEGVEAGIEEEVVEVEQGEVLGGGDAAEGVREDVEVEELLVLLLDLEFLEDLLDESGHVGDAGDDFDGDLLGLAGPVEVDIESQVHLKLILGSL